jgi:hypothetical protein
MMSGGKETRTINIGRFKTYKVRTKLTIGGEKDAKTLMVPNSFQTGLGSVAPGGVGSITLIVE